MVAKLSLSTQTADVAIDELYKYELLLKGVDQCKFDLVKRYHDQNRASKKLPALDSAAFAEELVRMHAQRPLDVAVSNEYDILSGMEMIPNAKCKTAPERK